ncbi:MAG: hypothetical protein MZU91_15170 [Desulfosudis oleivorans]|nr:hypothetical protein [Desulfosudis oleivorans]
MSFHRNEEARQGHIPLFGRPRQHRLGQADPGTGDRGSGTHLPHPVLRGRKTESGCPHDRPARSRSSTSPRCTSPSSGPRATVTGRT